MSESLPDLTSKIRVDTSELEGAVRKGAAVGAGLGSAIGSVAGLGISKAVGAVTTFVSGSVQAFSDFEDASGAASVVFGKGMGTVTKFADQAATSFGISKDSAIDAANTFGTFGKGAGLSGDALAKFSTGLTATAGDMASFKGGTPEEAIQAVGAALRGETEPIRRYGVLMDDASLRNEALKLGLIKTTKDALTPQQKVLAAQALITEQTKDATGDFARTSTSTANTQKRLAAETRNASIELGSKLAPAMTAIREMGLKVVQGLGALITKLSSAAGFIRDHSTAFTVAAGIILTVFLPAIIAAGVAAVVSAATTVAAWVAQGTAAVVNAAKTWLGYASMIAGWVASAAAAVAGAAVVVAGWVLMGTQSLLQAARIAAAWLIAMGPIGLVIALVVGLAVIVIKNWDTIKAATIAVWNAVWGFIKGVVDKVVGFVRDHWKLLLAILVGPIGIAVLLITKHWDDITAGARALVGKVREAFQAVVGVIRDRIDAAVALVRTIADRVRAVVRGFGTLLRDAGKALIQGLIDGIMAMWSKLTGAVGKVTGFIADHFPGSPVKRGPLRSFNNGHAGRELVTMLTDGFLAGVPDLGNVAAKMAQAAAGGNKAAMMYGLSRDPAGVGGYNPGPQGGSHTWAPSVTVHGAYQDPAAVAEAAISALTWQARLSGATT